MKILITLILLLSVISLSAENVVVETSSGEYDVYVPETYEALVEAYIQATTAYIEESNDYEDLKIAFDKYQDSAEVLIVSKDQVISDQKNLLQVKDSIITELEKMGIISFIPSAYYEYSVIGGSGGIGVGVLILDSFFTQVQIGYPFEARLSVGWKF